MKNKTLMILLAGAFAAAPCSLPRAARAEPKKAPPADVEEDEGPDVGKEAPAPPEARELPPRPGPGERERVLDDLRHNHPDLFKHLTDLRKRNPEAFQQKLKGVMPMLRDPDFRKDAIESMELEMEARRLAGAYREAKDEKEKAKIKADLQQALEKQFDAKLAMHEKRVKAMEKDLAELKGRIEKRHSHKKEIVEKQLGIMTGEEEGWDW